ncbi:hypothetical protein SARC_02006 [Sphaeroforma arctica JP610]|uniref:LCCL domain-containing protein n=1 Tax=Sphaeroforma arctica JP610 TaxID=667725 RepID=A0A0L0GC36_9EUKA|nr:hypothetical protein SARC_02006 [Sphaeroforma arctica JP610]KNC85823.1 hypothetical protein SARC_02006 [Sphaeroforma arctica JP610]|eukprot:XP_014159725.1 hypothetical protein SARC_02006 [Sphaeroforma arctica JP610]
MSESGSHVRLLYNRSLSNRTDYGATETLTGDIYDGTNALEAHEVDNVTDAVGYSVPSYEGLEDHNYVVRTLYYWIYRMHDVLLKLTTPQEYKLRHVPVPILVQKRWKSLPLTALPPIIHQFTIGLYLVFGFALLTTLVYYDTYAADTDYGKPYRLDCGDTLGALNKSVHHLDGWIPVRCPAYCQYRGAGEAHFLNETVLNQQSVNGGSTVEHDGAYPRFAARDAESSDIYLFTRTSPVCKAAVATTTLFSPWVGGCLIARVHPVKSPSGDDSSLTEETTNSNIPTNDGPSLQIVPDANQHLARMESRSANTLDSSIGTNELTKPQQNSLDLPRRIPLQLQACMHSHCQTFGHSLLIIVVLYTCGLLLLSPSRQTFFTALMMIGYWYVVFVVYPTYTANGVDRVDYALGTFFSFTVFIYAIFDFSVNITLYDTACGRYVFDTMLLFMLPYFVMLHMSYIKPFLDYSFTPGGFSGLSDWQVAIAVIITLAVIVLGAIQLAEVYRHGLLPYYFIGYVAVISLLCIITWLVDMSNHLMFHLHHYQLALLLLPMTRFSGRFSVFLSGLLLGMFVNGVACYGFDSTWGFKPDT